MIAMTVVSVLKIAMTTVPAEAFLPCPLFFR